MRKCDLSSTAMALKCATSHTFITAGTGHKAMSGTDARNGDVLFGYKKPAILRPYGASHLKKELNALVSIAWSLRVMEGDFVEDLVDGNPIPKKRQHCWPTVL